MDSAKMCGFLATSCFLLLILLGDPTEACTCAPSHPQTAYCTADVVIRAKFLGHSMESEWKRYEIQTTKVYKGSGAMQEIRFLYTSPSGGLCGYTFEHPPEEELVIAGTLENNRVSISVCSFIYPWARLSPEQRRGIRKNYSKGCSCEIVPCFYKPCADKPKSHCHWIDSTAESLACLPKSGTCTWKRLKGKAQLRQ